MKSTTTAKTIRSLLNPTTIIGAPIPGIDTTIPKVVMGCDPGPEYSAFAAVQRVGDSLQLLGVAYESNRKLIETCVTMENLDALRLTKEIPLLLIESVGARYGMTPGATVFNTARAAGIITARFAPRAKCIKTILPIHWRLTLGDTVRMSDADVRAALIDMLGEDADKMIALIARTEKNRHKLAKPIGCHLRDAAGVAVSAFLANRARRGLDMCETLWGSISD